MPIECRKVGHDPATASDLWWWQVWRVDHLHALGRSGRPFVCLLWWDAPDRLVVTAVSEIESVVAPVLAAGCLWLCCHGRNSSFVEDIADEVIVGDGSVDRSGDAPPTTNHGGALEDAIEFWLRDAFGTNRGLDRVCLHVGPLEDKSEKAFMAACQDPVRFVGRRSR
jgi:hypothetical protein